MKIEGLVNSLEIIMQEYLKSNNESFTNLNLESYVKNIGASKDPEWKFSCKKPSYFDLQNLDKKLVAKQQYKRGIENIISEGAKYSAICNQIRNFIIGYNSTRSLSSIRNLEYYEKLRPLMTALQFNDIYFAKAFITKIRPDDTLIKVEMKEILLDLLKDYDCSSMLKDAPETYINNGTVVEIKFNKLDKEIKRILKETDYTQLADAPIESKDKKNYRDYRSYLRKVKSQHDSKTILKARVLSFEEWIKVI